MVAAFVGGKAQRTGGHDPDQRSPVVSPELVIAVIAIVIVGAIALREFSR